MMHRPLTRPEPRLPVTAMRTHGILAPVGTHWRKATCEEVGCLHFHNGWGLNTAGLDADDVRRAKASGRRFTSEPDANGAEVLTFEAGQPCFKAAVHRIRVERPEIFVARDGDHRGNPTGRDAVVFSGADAWRDSLNTNLDKLRP